VNFSKKPELPEKSELLDKRGFELTEEKDKKGFVPSSQSTFIN